MEIEEDKRDLISREISKFRDTHKVTYQSAVFTPSIYWRKKLHICENNNDFLVPKNICTIRDKFINTKSSCDGWLYSCHH